MKWSLLLAMACGVADTCLLIMRPFFRVIVWATVLAIACYPLHQRVVQRTGRVALSAFVTSALVVLAVLAPLVFIGGVAVRQLFALGDSLRQALLYPDGMSRRVTATFAPIARRLGLDADAIVAWASGHASEWVAGAGQYTMSAAARIGGAILSFASRRSPRPPASPRRDAGCERRKRRPAPGERRHRPRDGRDLHRWVDGCGVVVVAGRGRVVPARSGSRA